MRIGINPSKSKGAPAYKPKRIGLASLAYVPVLEGYFQESLDIIQVHLTSLHASLDQECDIFVFDNGSCPEVILFFLEQWRQGVIDELFLSHHNYGKRGALNWVLSAMPNEYLGISDSDVFFRKGWLEKSLAIFESFDQAGMVSAQPGFFDLMRGEGKTAQRIATTDGFRIESIKPRPEVVDEYCNGVNSSPERRQHFHETNLQVAVNEHTGTRAVANATDMQFMIPRTVARKITPLPAGAAMGRSDLNAGEVNPIPHSVEANGDWLLSTEEPFVRHMGNSILGRNIPEIDAILAQQKTGKRTLPSPAQISGGQKHDLKISLRRTINRFPLLRRLIERAYNEIFSILYEER